MCIYLLLCTGEPVPVQSVQLSVRRVFPGNILMDQGLTDGLTDVVVDLQKEGLFR